VGLALLALQRVQVTCQGRVSRSPGCTANNADLRLRCPRALAQQSIVSLSVFAMGALGGALVPVFLLPRWMEWLSPFTPQYWAITVFQDVISRGASLADVILNVGVLLAFAAALFGAALPRLRSTAQCHAT